MVLDRLYKSVDVRACVCVRTWVCGFVCNALIASTVKLIISSAINFSADLQQIWILGSQINGALPITFAAQMDLFSTHTERTTFGVTKCSLSSTQF